MEKNLTHIREISPRSPTEDCREYDAPTSDLGLSASVQCDLVTFEAWAVQSSWSIKRRVVRDTLELLPEA